MPAPLINRLQTPLRQEFLKKLSANFRPLGKVGELTHGQLAFRAAAHQRGIILTEANVKDAVLHTIEISQEAGSAYASSGGTPASGTVTGGRAWDPVDYASGGAKTITSTSPQALGTRDVIVP